MVHSQISLQEELAKKKNPLTETIWPEIKKFTMTDKKRVNALINTIEYTIENGLEGDFVECGVWKGGNIMVMIKVLQHLGVERKIWLYDTFEGMSEPTDEDMHEGKTAQELMEKNSFIKCIAAIDKVKRNIETLNYSGELVYVKGKVEDTIPEQMPEKIALLRLDTDWYESTKHELIHLYPSLSETGVMIVDDYNFWDGATIAVDEYFEKSKEMTKISKCGVLTIK
jgi:O-methyltransferase